MPHVLIIDDDESVLKMLKGVLLRQGYDVTDANSGDAGIEMFKNNPFDLVITDLKMPETNGIEVLMKLKHLNPNIKILAISGAVDEFTLNSTRDLGADLTLPKPIEKKELLANVNQLLCDG